MIIITRCFKTLYIKQIIVKNGSNEINLRYKLKANSEKVIDREKIGDDINYNF